MSVLSTFPMGSTASGDNSQPHASQHAANGSDPVTPASIGALPISYVNAPADFNNLTASGIYVCIDYSSALNKPWGGYYPTTVITTWSETAGGGTQLAYDGYGSIAARSFKLENGAYAFDASWQYVGDATSQIRAYLNRSNYVNSENVNYTTPMARAVYAGTEDMVDGVTELTSGTIYIVYNEV